MKSTWSWACDTLKTSYLSEDNLKKKTCNLNRPTPEPVMRSCDTGCLQLSIHHNMDVQYQVAGSHTSYTCRRCKISHWFPRGVDGWVGGWTDGCMVTWLPKFLAWIDNQIFLATVQLKYLNLFTCTKTTATFFLKVTLEVCIVLEHDHRSCSDGWSHSCGGSNWWTNATNEGTSIASQSGRCAQILHKGINKSSLQACGGIHRTGNLYGQSLSGS